MNDFDRPTLEPYIDEELEVALHKIDKVYWQELRDMQVSRIQLDSIFHAQPQPPKRPINLRNILYVYAGELFREEASKYPNDDFRLPHWLSKLAERTGKRVMKGVDEVEASGNINSLAYHGVTESEMCRTVNEALRKTLEDFLQNNQASLKTSGIPSAVTERVLHLPSAPERLSSRVTSLVAAKKLEDYLKAKGMGLTEFATRAQTTDRTLRAFRKTGKVRRDIFENIAQVMGVTKDELLSD